MSNNQSTVLLLNVTMSDGTRHENVRPTNPDRIRWDKTANKHHWPTGDNAPFIFLTFQAWSALARSGDYSGTFEEFSERDCLDVDNAGADEENPTQPAATPDYA